MDTKLRIAQYGCGKMSKYLMKYVFDKGGEIVAAFDVNESVIGKDIGEIIGTENKGVKILPASKAGDIFDMLKPDACIIATMSTMADVKDAFMTCARNGVNAISTCEESLYPWNSSQDITKYIDKIAKENNCTICGSGYPDLFWGTLITTLAGALNKITKIKGISSYNVEDYGIALAKGHGTGLSIKEFEKEIGNYNNLSSEEIRVLVEKGEYIPSYMWNQNGWICSKLEITPISQTQKCVPHTYNEDLNSGTLGMTIKAGEATGMSAIVTTETEEGITIETECVGKVYGPEEFDKNQWTIEGEPTTTLIVNRPDTVELTCAIIVNRLPQLINSEAGYITTDKMPVNEYRSKPLHTYVK